MSTWAGPFGPSPLAAVPAASLVRTWPLAEGQRPTLAAAKRPLLKGQGPMALGPWATFGGPPGIGPRGLRPRGPTPPGPKALEGRPPSRPFGPAEEASGRGPVAPGPPGRGASGPRPEGQNARRAFCPMGGPLAPSGPTARPSGLRPLRGLRPSRAKPFGLRPWGPLRGPHRARRP